MLTEDYIMRMIAQAIAVLMTALGLKRSRRYSEALQSFDQAIETLLGLNADLAKQLEDSALLDLLTFRGALDVERVLLLADIYREQAEVFSLAGQPGNSRLASQRSLRLYLEALLAGRTELSVELVQKIEMLRRQASGATLPVETSLGLLDYLERLLQSSDTFLAEAGISRPSLAAAFLSLKADLAHLLDE
jgi:hypothetical protein